MNRNQRIAIWVLTLVGLLAAWKLFGQGFGNFRGDQPFLARNYTAGGVDPCSAGNVTNVANLKMWLKSDALVYSDNGSTLANNGDTVYLWKDSSTNGNNLVQATAGSRPYFTSSGPNGVPMIGFTNKLMDCDFNPDLGTSNTIFIVYLQRSGATDPSYLFAGAASDSSAEFVYNSDSIQMHWGGSFVQTLHPTPAPKNTWFYDTLWYGTVNTSYSWTNGISTGGATGPSILGIPSFRLGKSKTGADAATFEISEVIIFNGHVSLQDATNINCYLKTKYAL